MPATRIFDLARSAFNPFLFAEVGIEANGQSLSVVSLLARNGRDPWDEAASLAAMPAPRAIEALARIITATQSALWPLPAATEIARRLIAFLPTRGEQSPQARLATQDRLQTQARPRAPFTIPLPSPWQIALLLLIVALGALAFQTWSGT